MNWEIKTMFIAFNGELQNKLNAECVDGWEPYAHDGSFHYFKRKKNPEIKGGAIEEVEALRAELGIGSTHIPVKTNNRKK